MRHFLFSTMDNDEQNAVADAMTSFPVTKGQVIIRQGDKGNSFYVVESGKYTVLVDGKARQNKYFTGCADITHFLCSVGNSAAPWFC